MLEFRSGKFKIIIAVLLLSGSFLFLGSVKNASAYLNSYSKAYNGTLTAAEWNNLASDFLNKSGGATMTGPLGIGTSTPASGLYVNGPIYATNFSGGAFTGFIDAANVMGGSGSSFGSASGGGNYSFPSNLGIGTTNPQFKLDLNLGTVNTNTNIGYNVLADATNNVGYSGYNLQLNNTSGNASGYMRLARTSGTAFLGMEIGSQSVNGIRFLTHATTPVEVMRINAAGSVGIGTTNPQASLDTTGLIKMRTATITQSEDVINKGYLDSALASTSATIISQFSTSSLWNGTSTANIWSNNTGNVGIGVTNPQYKLSLGATNDKIGYYSDASHNNSIELYNSSNGNMNFQTTVGSTANGNFTFMTTGGGGNVGIGTTNPLAKLDINATGTSLTMPAMSIVGSGTWGSGYQIAWGNYAKLSQTSSGSHYISWGMHNNGTNWVRDYTSANKYLSYFGLTTGDQIEFGGAVSNLTTDANPTLSPKMVINTASGNIGIGTTNPVAQLHVMSATSTDAAAVIKFDTPNGGSGDVQTADISFTSASNNSLDIRTNYSSVGNKITLTPGGVTTMTLLGSGNVGIGTTVPNDTFSIGNSGAAPAGSAKTGHNYTSTYLATDSYALANYGLVQTLISNATSSLVAGNLWNGTLNGSIYNGTTGAGNVGIGNTNPQSILHITTAAANNVPAEAIHLQNPGAGSDTGASIGFYHGLSITGTKNARIRAGGMGTNLGNLYLEPANGTDFTTAMTLLGSGNVGIGVTNPINLLTVAKLDNTNNSTIKITSNGSTDEMLHFTNETSSNTWTIGRRNTASTFEIAYNTNTTGDIRSGNIMSILNTGNIGIGTTTPSRKLTIEGAARTELLINGNTGNSADSYVAAMELRSNTDYRGRGILLSVADGAAEWYAGVPYTGTMYSIGYDPSGGISEYVANSKLAVLTSGNVGIGTTAPNDTFSIGNSGAAPAGSAKTGHNYTSTYLATDSYALVNYGLVQTLILNATSSLVAGNLWNGALNGSIYNGTAGAGNVGIGTTTPSEKLGVIGNIGISPTSVIGSGVGYSGSSGAANYATLQLYSGANGYTTLNNQGYGIKFQTAGSDRLTILNNGNVGIGTTNPAGPLNVVKTAGDNAIYADTYSATAGNSNYWFSRRSHDNTLGNLTTTLSGDYQGVFYFQGVNTSNAFAYGAKIIAQQNGAAGTFIPTDLNFSTYSATAQNTNQLVLSNNGNIGIGAAGPNYMLTIDKNTSGTPTSLMLRLANSGGTNTPEALFQIENESVHGFGLHGRSGVGNLDKLIQFWNLNTGNVGIGTSAPNDSFSIGNAGAAPAGSAKTGHNFTSTYLATDSYALVNYGLVQTLISNATSSITLWGGTVGGNIWALNSGNTGVGTTNPFTKLEVAGALKFGDTADTCDNNHSGTLRYNSTSDQTYLCDGVRWINQKNCGLMTDDAGQTYGTVQIGGQCWMAENINIGTMLASGATNPTTTDNTIQKWCYNNDPAQCLANGGLYNWDEAMRGSLVSGARGICPSGWHIPSDTEYNKLEKTILGVIASPNAQYACNMSVTGWQRCADNSGTDTGGTYGAGKSLKAVGVGSGVGLGDDLVGFAAKLTGYRNTDGTFPGLGSSSYFWSSTPSGANAISKYMNSGYSTITRYADVHTYGFSVRCVRD